MSLYDREHPFVRENRASLERKAQPPKDLLAWFLTEFRSEIPARLHARGTWADRKDRDDREDYEAVGGSLLGTPRTHDGFRAYLEGSPRETELARLTDSGVTVGTQAYRMPLRAAMAQLAGRGSASDTYPFMARLLYRIASMDGDVHAACASFGELSLPLPYREVYVREALRRLWEKYDPEPPARTIRTEKVA